MKATIRPTVLCFSGHDPTGGAGIQADIETLGRLGCHPITVITALTAQDTIDVQAIWSQREEDFLAQVRCLLADIRPVVVKVGLLGSAGIARVVAEVLGEMPELPIVLDPILAAGGGMPLARTDLLKVLREELLPRVTVLTPNTLEARQLVGGQKSLEECAAELLRMGCGHVFITGTHDVGDRVVNRLYGAMSSKEWTWPRLPQVYHGSGCTLASALAGFLARGLALDAAAYEAQRFTFQALVSAYAPGRGQYLPNRSAD